MTYKLFLDDVRMPPSGENYVICRSAEDAVVMINDTYGYCPTFISFDHDLGENVQSGYDFVKWLVWKDMEMNGEFIPDNFDFHIHSQNVVGGMNILCYLESYLQQKERN